MSFNTDPLIINLIKNSILGVKEAEAKAFIHKNKITSLANNIFNNEDPNFLRLESQQLQTLKELLLVKLAGVTKILSESQIPYVLLKGLHLINQFREYGKLRDIKDLDLLIDQKDLKLAIKVLEENGWKVEFPVGKSKQRLELFVNHAVTLTDTSSGVELDLHWKIAEGYVCCRRFSDDYLKNSLNVSGEFSYIYPNWEYQVLLLAVHSYKNNWQQLQSFIDLYVILISN
ncbi:MAG: nucleotidyltransferase family protein, partial [Candidatus Paceibacterota bacterium]